MHCLKGSNDPFYNFKEGDSCKTSMRNGNDVVFGGVFELSLEKQLWTEKTYWKTTIMSETKLIGYYPALDRSDFLPPSGFK